MDVAAAEHNAHRDVTHHGRAKQHTKQGLVADDTEVAHRGAHDIPQRIATVTCARRASTHWLPPEQQNKTTHVRDDASVLGFGGSSRVSYGTWYRPASVADAASRGITTMARRVRRDLEVVACVKPATNTGACDELSMDCAKATAMGSPTLPQVPAHHTPNPRTALSTDRYAERGSRVWLEAPRATVRSKLFSWAALTHQSLPRHRKPSITSVSSKSKWNGTK